MNLGARARDWSEIQERMLVPLYETVHERLEVGPATRLLGLRCGSGLALLMAAARGAAVTGVDSSPERLALARERLLPDPVTGVRVRGRGARIVQGSPRDTAGPQAPAYNLITAFEPIGGQAGGAGRGGVRLAQGGAAGGPRGGGVGGGGGPGRRAPR
ncbi:SAM-dependent methyltransferase, partial [Streptomyces sp. NPDC127079]|uniref:SAM-dependent methyltransferase n=1 Tax=Streptomyces sp. NPDC127079 TaxID=3347132 RepID=UPI00366222E3